MKNKKNITNILWWKSGLVLFSRISSWIIGPIFFAVLIGSWLDKKYNSDAWIFLLIIGGAILISSFGIFKETIKEMRKNNKDIENKL
ncbi:MAG: hypothetical protein A2271_04845 [Candidatus Moranbacteria bacterium RIFOXYA12_FULL_35_19]|nr:MAG: hypothetical protein A2271_04845 [Candidatus Moranbacteria bacterium RIFOXYA12_FULL_35_19]